MNHKIQANLSKIMALMHQLYYQENNAIFSQRQVFTREKQCIEQKYKAIVDMIA